MFYVEHCKTRLFVLTLLLTLAGCKKPLEQPETVDPIYLKLSATAANYQKLITDEEAAQESAKKSLLKTDLTAGEIRQARKDIASRDRRMRLMTQDQRYAQIRARSRLIKDREKYTERYDKDLPWPDTEEVSEFDVSERLIKARTQKWEDHLPKTNVGAKAEPPNPEAAESAKPTEK